MNIHEYQAKEVFRRFGVPVPEGYLAHSPTEAEFAMRRISGDVAVVKAQVHAGGRGKGGGVKLVKTYEECREQTEKMIGMTLVTPQTGAEGKLVRKVYIEAGCDIAHEYYLALLLDRESAKIVVMASTEGGMDIEEVAENTPEKIVKAYVDPSDGLQGYQVRKLQFGLGLKDKKTKKGFQKLLGSLINMFIKLDYSLLEINPLVLTGAGDWLALDGKMNFDDNALYRHKEIAAMRDYQEEDAREVEASKFGLSYIGLDGNIGCMVNGAGLAMATMDIIKKGGGEPANFLDVGGGATEAAVTNAFRILLSDKQVKAIFVNIFGGIMQCDIIANGIVGASKQLGIEVPVVVRLEGTNVEKGKEIIANSGLKLIPATNMEDGARKVVEAAGLT